MRKQDRNKLVYFLRGLGVGILVTVIVMSIRATAQPESKTNESMSRKEIIEKAKEYGLVEPLDNKLDQVLKTALPSITPMPTTLTIPTETAK